MTLDNVVQALESAMKGEKINEKLLKNKKVKDTLTAYFIEQETRPELAKLITFPDLMKEYLSLSLESRESLDAIRQKHPGYLEGDINFSPGTGKMEIELYHKIHLRKALPQIVEAYIRNAGVTQVSPSSWFRLYDIKTGNRLRTSRKKFGKRIPQGINFYRLWSRIDKEEPFEKWVEKHLEPSLLKRLQATSYYQRDVKPTLAEIVSAFIKYQPSRRRGPASLANWFGCYDIKTGKLALVIKDGKTTRISKSAGNTHYERWHRKEKNKGISFDDWIEKQLSPEQLKKLRKTDHYNKKEYSVSDITNAFINHQPKSDKGLVSLGSWFQSYNIETGEQAVEWNGSNEVRKCKPPGERYYAKWIRSDERKNNVTFEQCVERQLTPSLKKKLAKTEYYTKTDATVADIVESYILHRPATQMGHVSIASYFLAYNLDGEKVDKHEPGSKFYQQWKKSVQAQTIAFKEWILQQLPTKLARQLEKTPYYQQQEITIDDVVKAYIKHQPQSNKGPVPLKNWFARYDINTVKRTKKSGQGSKHYLHWKKTDKKTEFDEWILNQVSEQLQNQYLQKIHGIKQGVQVLKSLKQAINGQKFDGELTNKEPVRKMLTAYYIERDIHPEITQFSPYKTMLYLNTTPEEREEQLKVQA